MIWLTTAASRSQTSAETNFASAVGYHHLGHGRPRAPRSGGLHPVPP